MRGSHEVSTSIDDDPADVPLSEVGIASDDDAIERQRLRQLQGSGDLVAIRRHRQLPDHALQRGAERRQQMNPSGLRCGTAAESLTVNRNVACGPLRLCPRPLDHRAAG